MRFSIFSVVTLVVPSALLSLAIAEHFSEVAESQWKAFTMESMNHHLEAGRSVLVFGAPHGHVSRLTSLAIAELNSDLLQRHCRNQNYALLKFTYRPFAEPDPSTRHELEWMVRHGGYKEPSLVCVEPDGSKRAIRHIVTPGSITDFLSPIDMPTRKSLYLGLAIAAFVGWTVMIAFRWQHRWGRTPGGRREGRIKRWTPLKGLGS